MPKYGRCQVVNCSNPAAYRIQFWHQPRNIRCCSDCAEELAQVGDDVTRLTA